MRLRCRRSSTAASASWTSRAWSPPPWTGTWAATGWRAIWQACWAPMRAPAWWPKKSASELGRNESRDMTHLVDLIRGLIAWTPLGLPAFLFVITLVVFFHELGHFLVARFFRVKVDVFSI